jgi:hypothetical protein
MVKSAAAVAALIGARPVSGRSRSERNWSSNMTSPPKDNLTVVGDPALDAEVDGSG